MTPSRFAVFLSIWLIIAVSACGSRPAVTPDRLIIPPGAHLRLTVEPLPGTPEPNPTLTLHVNLVDAQTGQPVRGDVLLGDETCQGQVIQRHVSQLTVTLPGQVKTTPIYLCILAGGYTRWSQGFRYRLDHSRIAFFTVELKNEQQ